MVSHMRPLLISIAALAVVAPSCSNTPTTPSPTQAAITVSAPSQAPVRACAACGGGELEVAADLTVAETAGVGGSIVSIDVLLRRASTVLAGPGQYNAANVALFAGGTNRVPARGSLIVRNVAMHFSNAFREQLPATFSMQVTFRDDNGHTLSGAATVEAVP